jgi:hypothetical protein
VPVGRGVGVNIGVHQVYRDASHLDHPHFGINHTAGQLYLDHDFAPVPVEGRQGRYLGEAELFVDGFLGAVAGDLLAKVALRI